MGLYNTKLFLPPPLLPSPRPLSQLKQETAEIIKKLIIKKLRDGILAAYCCLSWGSVKEGRIVCTVKPNKNCVHT
jgi:hypothetical protein